MYITTFIFVEKIRRFVVTEFVKLSDEFDIDLPTSKNSNPTKTKAYILQ